jgi:hypothetical protein
VAMHTLAFLNNLMGMDGLVILVLGLLLFGRRLPELRKNLFKTAQPTRDIDSPYPYILLLVLAIVILVVLQKILNAP